MLWSPYFFNKSICFFTCASDSIINVVDLDSCSPGFNFFLTLVSNGPFVWFRYYCYVISNYQVLSLLFIIFKLFMYFCFFQLGFGCLKTFIYVRQMAHCSWCSVLSSSLQTTAIIISHTIMFSVGLLSMNCSSFFSRHCHKQSESILIDTT